MFILEAPFVSDFLQRTVVDNQIPVLKTDFTETLTLKNQMNLLEQDVFFEKVNATKFPALYSNSENSSVWLNKYCQQSKPAIWVNDFKNKSKLREIFAAKHKNVWFKKCSLVELKKLDVQTLPKPFVIKPLRGFASICIHSVFSDADWQHALTEIEKEVVLMQNVFPDKVVSLQEFLLETFVEGTEIALDAYFDENGQPVILNILNHLHQAKNDMSDRLYITSAEIIRHNYAGVLDYLVEIGNICGLKNFPLHLEMIEESNGNYFPIEINPMRFMGFCVADVEFYFYGINPYEYFYYRKKPDWNSILETRENKIFGMMGIDIPKHLDRSKINFNYDKFIAHFSKPVHYIKMDYRKFPMSIYMFAEVEKQNFTELEYILHSDIMEFIEI